MAEKLGPTSLAKSRVQKEPISIHINNAPSLSYGNLRLLNRPSGVNISGNAGTRMLKQESCLNNPQNQHGIGQTNGLYVGFGTN